MKPTKVDPLLAKAIWHSHKTSELNNDEGFITTDDVPVYTAGEGIEITEENVVNNVDKGSDVVVPVNSDFDLGGLGDVDDTGKATGKALVYNNGWKVRNKEDIFAGGCTITRNEEGDITSITYTNKTISITRSEGLITSTTDGVYLRTVNRNEAGLITGITVSEV